MGMFDGFGEVAVAFLPSKVPSKVALPDTATEREFWLPGPFFTYREKRKKKKGRCPTPKSNAKQARIIPGKGFAVVTEHPRIKAAEKALIEALLPLAPREPWDGPILMDVTFVFVPPLKPQWRYEAALAGAVHAVGANHGDRDNLHKLLADAMEKAGFYTNDARITTGNVAKAYGEEPGYRVRLKRISEPASFEEWKAWKIALGM